MRKEGNCWPQVTFCYNLTMNMLKNGIGIVQQPKHSPVKTRKLPLHTTEWEIAAGTWKQTKTIYLHWNCVVSNNLTRMYSKRNPAVPLCHGCHHDHLRDQSADLFELFFSIWIKSFFSAIGVTRNLRWLLWLGFLSSRWVAFTLWGYL